MSELTYRVTRFVEVNTGHEEFCIMAFNAGNPERLTGRDGAPLRFATEEQVKHFAAENDIQLV